MEQYDVYQQIAERTDGDIHIGVVGPVRTGKSTLIRRFMDLLVLPGLDASWHKERINDELPLSAAGRTIMTTQVQFVPGEAVEVHLSNVAQCKVRLVDCVGYMVDGAKGMLEDGQPRMVRTPWFDEEVPFEVAAETGTRKVIQDHSTIGLVVTTDGSITEIPRSHYVPAEIRVVNELKSLGKPFVVILNSMHPQEEATQTLRKELAREYDVPVLALDVLNMQESEVTNVIEQVLFEFPVREMRIQAPVWIRSLPRDHWLWLLLLYLMKKGGRSLHCLRDYQSVVEEFAQDERIGGLTIGSIHPGNGVIEAEVMIPPALYYQILSEECGCEVQDEAQLMSMMREMVVAKKEYDHIAGALQQVRQTGYGLVTPSIEDMMLDEPQIVKQGSRSGVKLKASAPSWHIMRVDIQTEVSPVLGTEKQSEELVRYLLSEFENNPTSIWKTEIFGKSLHDLVREGISQKLMRMPDDAQDKIRTALQRVINDGGGGMLCILL